MFRICLVLALLIASSTAGAADIVTLRGMVLQQGSNRPIVDAVVFVVADDRLSTSTDDAGYFDLDVPGPGNYAISAVRLRRHFSRNPTGRPSPPRERKIGDVYACGGPSRPASVTTRHTAARHDSHK